MKTTLLTLFVALTISCQIFSQWEWLNPRPHGNANNRIAFGGNPDEYTIVGNAGIIMKTTNDGVNWEIQNSGTNVNLNDIYIDNNDGIAVGSSGTILRTTDRGSPWLQVNSGTSTNLTAVAFPTSNIGIITGWNGLILRTTNGGTSWDSIATLTTQRLYGVSFADADNGYAVGDAGVIIRTTNGGVSWNMQTSGTAQSLYDISYINSSTAVASGWGGTIIRTTDGGSNWNSIGFTTYIRYGVSFTDSDHGVVVGDVNNVVHTTDGGASWTFPSTNLMTTNFYCIRFYNSTKGIAVGEYGAIFKTDDGGITWQLITEGLLPRYQSSGGVNVSSLSSVQCINSNRAVISGTYQFFYTNNGGVSWDYIPLNDYPQLIDLDFVNQDNGAMIGIKPSLQGSDILGTTNSGSNWSVQYTSNSIKLNGIDLSTSTHGVAVGNAGKIFRTTNGGQNWTEQTPPQIYDIYNVFLVDSLIGYSVGKYGNILKTTDGGISWTQMHTNFFYNLYGVSFTDANNGIAVGDSIRIGVSYGLILRTTNGGTNWSKQILDSPLSLWAVNFTDNNNWYVGGTSVGNQSMAARGRIFRSENAGISWYEQSIPVRSTRGILGISAFDNNILLAVSVGGMVLGTINGGGTSSVEEISNGEIPSDINLSQNYPNPFNPTTRIKFQIVEPGDVSLKVYDILGKEVTTLVNEKLSAGTYEATFNASGLASGIYFYKLQSGSFVETKKMILLR